MEDEYPELYSDADMAWLREQLLWEGVEAIASDIDVDDIDPAYWGLDADAWAVMTEPQKKAVTATFIVEDRWAMQWAGIEPDEWVSMSLDEREEVVRAERAARA